MPEQYTYAVARIHTKESSMLNSQDIERILAASDLNEAMAVLAEKGFDSVGDASPESVISAEMWHPMVSANVGYEYRKIVNMYYDETCDDTAP